MLSRQAKEPALDLSFSLWLLRSSRALTQDELARRLSTTRQTISNWETGEKIPTLDSLRKLCHGLSVPVRVCLQLAEARANS
jgi:transcriptional regulator with XRE-family HTH domain